MRTAAKCSGLGSEATFAEERAHREQFYSNGSREVRTTFVRFGGSRCRRVILIRHILFEFRKKIELNISNREQISAETTKVRKEILGRTARGCWPKENSFERTESYQARNRDPENSGPCDSENSQGLTFASSDKHFSSYSEGHRQSAKPRSACHPLLRSIQSPPHVSRGQQSPRICPRHAESDDSPGEGD